MKCENINKKRGKRMNQNQYQQRRFGKTLPNFLQEEGILREKRRGRKNSKGF